MLIRRNLFRPRRRKLHTSEFSYFIFNHFYKLSIRKDPQLPSGWRYYDNGRGAIFFRDSEGTRFSSRRRALAHMYKVGGFTKEAIYYIRDGLLDEGWFYHQDLPPSWMYKLYNHKIEACFNIFFLSDHYLNFPCRE